MPVAVNKSELLRSCCDSEYFIDHADLLSCIQTRVMQHEQGAAHVTLTRSPSAHLTDTLLETFPYPITSLRLSDLSSESDLEDQLAKFYSRQTADSSMLLMQCDPVVCSQSLINHAMYICSKAREEYLFKWQPTFGQRHVVFLVHLPNGIKNRRRHWLTALYRPWETSFVDDIRTVSDSSKGKLLTMLSSSLYQLGIENVVSIPEIIGRRYQSALALCQVPSVSDEDVAAHFNPINRIRHVHKLLKDERFLTVFKDLVLATLYEYRNVGDDGLHFHASLAVNQLAHGTLIESLGLACDVLVTQALGQALRYLDTNFNLHCLHNDAMKDLWIALCHSNAVLDKTRVASSSLIGGSGIAIDRLVRNLGQYDSLVCRFPFSWRLISILNNKETREKVESSKQGHQQLESIFNGFFPDIISKLPAALYSNCGKFKGLIMN